MIGAALRVAVRRAGAPGGIRFTRRQLYFELQRAVLPLYRAPRRPRFTLPAVIGPARFEAALARLGDVPGLLPEAAPPPPARPEPPDLYDYGLPRLLVCQDASIAAMLLANGLHMESACPVFAAADLPLDTRLMATLDGATIHVLHDASPVGVSTVEQVRAAFPGIAVNPLGLRPAHAAALHLPTGRGAGGPGPATWLPWERRWLAAGHLAEVAAVNPARLLRTVHRLVRGIARVRPPLPKLRQIRGIGYLSWPDGSAA